MCPSCSNGAIQNNQRDQDQGPVPSTPPYHTGHSELISIPPAASFQIKPRLLNQPCLAQDRKPKIKFTSSLPAGPTPGLIHTASELGLDVTTIKTQIEIQGQEPQDAINPPPSPVPRYQSLAPATQLSPAQQPTTFPYPTPTTDP